MYMMSHRHRWLLLETIDDKYFLFWPLNGARLWVNLFRVGKAWMGKDLPMLIYVIYRCTFLPTKDAFTFGQFKMWQRNILLSKIVLILSLFAMWCYTRVNWEFGILLLQRACFVSLKVYFLILMLVTCAWAPKEEGYRKSCVILPSHHGVD